MAICMFAAAPPHAMEAVTNGVGVRVSSIFIPEHSRELPPRFFFAYRCCALPVKQCPLRAVHQPHEASRARHARRVLHQGGCLAGRSVREDPILQPCRCLLHESVLSSIDGW